MSPVSTMKPEHSLTFKSDPPILLNDISKGYTASQPKQRANWITYEILEHQFQLRLNKVTKNNQTQITVN